MELRKQQLMGSVRRSDWYLSPLHITVTEEHQPLDNSTGDISLNRNCTDCWNNMEWATGTQYVFYRRAELRSYIWNQGCSSTSLVDNLFLGS